MKLIVFYNFNDNNFGPIKTVLNLIQSLLKNNNLFYLSGIILYLISISSCKKFDCVNVGNKMNEFTAMEWINGMNQSIKKLNGKVVLIRWWSDDCIYCINSSEALNEWHLKYQNENFQILGIYHVKPIERIVNKEEIQEFTREKGFQFPIGIDKDWMNLKNYWLGCEEKDFTSFSILLDKTGKIRYIHNGGSYFKDNDETNTTVDNEIIRSEKDYNTIDSLIQKLLVE
ncbi:MAG: TlpA family protein disulfide reductase [Saprospiraceae bacterium]|nr:TlpA family protein disulfide reductase [Saprospiraceae bacterium]